MKAKDFKHQNVVIAKDQPEYTPLPALRVTVPRLKLGDPSGHVVFCMGLTFWERVRVLFLGHIWVSLMTFGALTPSYHTTRRKEVYSIPWDKVSKIDKFNLFLNLSSKSKSLRTPFISIPSVRTFGIKPDNFVILGLKNR